VKRQGSVGKKPIPAARSQSPRLPVSIFCLAAAVRIAVAASLWDLPLVRTPKLDSAEYLFWAQRIAAGDWTWPAVAQHAPGYPLFLALLLTIGSGSLKAVMLMQALVGAATAALVAAIARRWFGATAGLAAGVVYAVYGPAAYADVAMLAEGLLLFLLASSLWALSREPIATFWLALAGALAGAAIVVRPTAAVPAIAALVWLLRTGRPLRTAAVFAAAVLVILVPVLVKNWSSGSPGLQGYGGLNAYIGNSPEHDGRATFRLGAGWDALNAEAARSGLADPAAQDRYYLAKTAREIRTNPGGFLRVLAAKALWTVQAEEARDSHSYYFFTGRSAALRWLPRFALLFPLAIVGGISVWRRRPGRAGDRWLFVAMIAANAAVAILLVAGFRYRMPLIPLFAIAAGAGLHAIAVDGRERRTRDLAVYGVAAAAAIALSHAVHDPRNTNVAEEWAFSGSALITEHRLDEAMAAYRRALELDSRSGSAWDGFGLTLYNQGRFAEARAAFERALAIDRDSARATYHLALVDDRQGRLAQAAAGYESALRLSPFDEAITRDLSEARRKLATELGMSGRSAEARDLMRSVVALAPRNGEAWLDLCLLSLDLGDAAGASAALQRAREFGADPARLQFAVDALARTTPPGAVR
jgi:tetratricopeptide (TPR) repeat protein